MNRWRKRSSRGFTLMELIIVLGLAAIVFFIAIPNYNTFRRRQAAATAARDFEYEIKKLQRYCRSVEQNVTVSFPSSEPNTFEYTFPTTGKSIKKNVSKMYMGAVMTPDGGDALQIEASGELGSGTTLSAHAQGAGQPGYVKVIFTNGPDVTYEVWVLDNGDALLKQM